MTIDTPQLLSINLYNAIDAGGYWKAGAASSGYTSINKTITTNTIDRQSVFKVAKAINGINVRTGEPNGLTERRNETTRISKIILDTEQP